LAVAAWWFSAHSEDAKRREPIVGEFFVTESISNVVSALVREFVQNSLDASQDEKTPVEVHFSIGELTPGPKADAYFSSFWDHYYACEDSVRGKKRPNLKGAPCRYLVAEDFNTTGLNGDASVNYIDTSKKVPEVNDFYYFIRTEGASGKSMTDRGNWGVGKYTYAKTSNINSYFAYSVRKIPNVPVGNDTVLIGQSILNYHEIGSTVYQPDGWWGLLGGVSGSMPMPFGSSNHETLEFVDDFKLFRTDEMGLSLIVPYIHKDIDAAGLMRAALGNFLTPILRGQLEIVIRGEDQEFHQLNRGNLEAAVQEFDPNLWAEFGPEVELVRWWDKHNLKPDAEGFFTLPSVPENEQTSWDSRIDESTGSEIRDRLELGQNVAVRVPICIRGTKAGSLPEQTFVDLLLGPDPDHTKVPIFYREGIRISEVKSETIPGVRAVVLADDKPITGFLGSAEGPAHTDWKNNRERFSGSFKNGRDILGFIKSVPSGLVGRVRSGQNDTDLGVALDFFSISDEPETTPKPPKPKPIPTPDTGGGGIVDPPPPPPPPPPVPPKLQIGDLVGGVVIRNGGSLVKGAKVVVDLAYDTLSGDAISKWINADFDVAKSPIAVSVNAGVQLQCAGNHLEFEVQDSEMFELTVSGFDRNRDLFVKAKAS
jgi:hypothetical protein